MKQHLLIIFIYLLWFFLKIIIQTCIIIINKIFLKTYWCQRAKPRWHEALHGARPRAKPRCHGALLGAREPSQGGTRPCMVPAREPSQDTRRVPCGLAWCPRAEPRHMTRATSCATTATIINCLCVLRNMKYKYMF